MGDWEQGNTLLGAFLGEFAIRGREGENGQSLGEQLEQPWLPEERKTSFTSLLRYATHSSKII